MKNTTDETSMLDKIVKALHLAVDLGQAEQAQEPFKSQIDAFMQNPDVELNDEAQTAFEDWALVRLNINRAFRRIGINPQECWIAKDYKNAGAQLLAALQPTGLGVFHVP